MNKCHFAALTAFSLIAPGTTLAVDSGLEVEYAKYRLGNPACGVSDSTWALSSGPGSALVTNSGDESYVEIFEPGSYEFSRTCCEASVNSGYGSSLPRVNSLMSSPSRMGFGGNTTGGADAAEYTVVTSLADSGEGSLREALLGDTPAWIVFDESIHGGTIRIDSPINVQSGDITLDAAGADITLTVSDSYLRPMLVFRGGNTIIHGITIDGNDRRVEAIMLREQKNYWVDHVTITNIDGEDAFTVGQGSRGADSASEVTISNYHIYNSAFGYLAGGEDGIENYPPHRTTIHSSNLSARDRNPRIKNFGTAHVLNNYIHSFIYKGSHSGTDTVLYTENNVYSGANAKTKNTSLGGGLTARQTGVPGVVYSSGDLMIDGAEANGQTSFVSAREFGLPYDYTVMPASEVIEHVLANAGASNAPDPGSNSSTFSGNGQSVCSVDTRALVYSKQ